MTAKPTIEATIVGTGHVVSTAEWNTNVIQEATYVQEVLAGTNSDKIPYSALGPDYFPRFANTGDAGKKIQVVSSGTITNASNGTYCQGTMSVSWPSTFGSTPTGQVTMLNTTQIVWSGSYSSISTTTINVTAFNFTTTAGSGTAVCWGIG